VKIRRLWLKDVGPFAELNLEIPPGTNPDLADVVLITGPNGSGKTTLLYAIASILGPNDQLAGRWKTDSEAAVAVEIAGTVNIFASRNGYEAPHHERMMTGGHPFLKQPTNWAPVKFGQMGRANGSVDIWNSGPYSGKVWQNELRFGEVVTLAGPLFAYGAFRNLKSSQNLSVGNIQSHPLGNAALFEQSSQMGSFEVWVANTRTQLALAREDGDAEAVLRYERTIGLIEGAISDLMGESFVLKVQRDPLEVHGVVNGLAVPLDLLPDGLRSSLAWLGDVLRRLDRLERPLGVDPLSLPIIVLLDEIDAHLHPAWQRKILYVAERLLPNAQLIVSTHSPFVVQSASDACVVKLGERGAPAEVLGSQSEATFDAVLADVLGMRADQFAIELQRKVEAFKKLRDDVLRGKTDFRALELLAQELASANEYLDISLRQHLEDVKHRLKVT
jgi:predicted ATP-binding protein involved in virulence